MREKQIEKAQKLLLTKLRSNDYLAQQVVMTPEHQRVSWQSDSEKRVTEHGKMKLLSNINMKKVQSF